MNRSNKWFVSTLLFGVNAVFADCKTPCFTDCEKAVPQCYMNGEMGDPTPPASPYTQGRRVIVTGDFLWWIARENALEYAFNVDTLSYSLTSGDTGSSWVDTTEVKKPDFQWDPGFRVGLGYRFNHDFWEAKARWTWFHTTASDSSSRTANATNENILVFNDGYTWAETTGTNPVTANWDLHYNLLEAGFSRSFFLGKNLDLDMQFGAAFTWIDQKYHIQAPQLTSSYASLQNFALKFSNEFWGGGLFVSLAPEWNIWRRLSLFGNVSGYLLHGTFDIHQNWFNETANKTDMSIHKDYARDRAALGGKLGLQWETSPLNCSYHIALALSYEGMIWFKQNLLSQIMTIYTENFERRGDLEMQGITFSARADF